MAETVKARARRLACLLVLVSLVAAVAAPIAPTAARSGGITSDAKVGCVCHGSQATGVGPELVLPTGYEAGKTYNITVAVTGGPTAKPDGQQGGFYLDVSAGELKADGGLVTATGKEATHTSSGNKGRTWSIQWVAPSAEKTTFTLRTNSVNGDTAATDADDWNMKTFTLDRTGGVIVTPQEPEPRLDVPANMTELTVAAMLVFLVIVTVVAARRPPKGRRRSER